MQGSLYTNCSFSKIGYCFVALTLRVVPETEQDRFDLLLTPLSTAKAIIAIRCPKPLRDATYGQETELVSTSSQGDLDAYTFSFEYEGLAKKPDELHKLATLGLAMEVPMAEHLEESLN